jgi:hypothetical protein
MRKNPWSNPAYRKKMLRKRKIQWTQLARLHHKAGIKRHYETLSSEEKLLKISAALRTAHRKLRSPYYRKVISARTRKQNLRQWADPAWRRKMKKVRKLQGQKPENKKKLSDAAKKVWKRKEYRQKNLATRQQTMYSNPKWLRKIAKTGFKKGKPSWNAGQTKYTHPALMKISKKLEGRIPTYGRKQFWYAGNGRLIAMRSTWEVAYAEWLDKQKVKWVYEPAYFHIGKGNWTGENYKPDFLLPKEKRYVEIKGYLSEVNAAKMTAFKKKFKDVKFEVLDKRKLKRLGVKVA